MAPIPFSNMTKVVPDGIDLDQGGARLWRLAERRVNYSLHAFAAFCGTSAIPGVLNVAILAALALAGASGSLAHCIPMCGPFVLGQVSDRLARVPAGGLCQFHRLRTGVLLPYHCGRISTYAGLGALAALSRGELARLPWFRHLSGVLLLIGALVFLSQFLRALLRPALAWSAQALRRLGFEFGRLVGRHDRSRPASGFLLGVLLGFLPCGLLYGALAVAAAAPSPLGGALRMLAFGVGTIPTLVAVGVAGPAFGRAAQRTLTGIGRPVLLLNGIVLAALALYHLST